MNYKPLESTIYLGWIYTEARAYDAAEASFREAIARIREQQKKHGKRLADIDSGRGEDTPINELLTICYLLWSFSYSDRGVRLEKAVHLAQNARWLIQQLDQPKVQPYEATYFDCLGYAHLKMGQIEEAARELKHSVTLSVDAGAYTRLAEACLARATASPTVRDSCIAEARQCCAKARGADLRQQYSQVTRTSKTAWTSLPSPLNSSQCIQTTNNATLSPGFSRRCWTSRGRCPMLSEARRELQTDGRRPTTPSPACGPKPMLFTARRFPFGAGVGPARPALHRTVRGPGW
jgi:tetratricopeptide (TPR) repeat protein